jgi:hypothetical protein
MNRIEMLNRKLMELNFELNKLEVKIVDLYELSLKDQDNDSLETIIDSYERDHDDIKDMIKKLKIEIKKTA